MRCPACSQALLVVERDSIELDWCPACRGVWFDAGELEMLAQKTGQAIKPGMIGEPARAQSEALRRCPRCHRKMEKVAPAGAERPLLDRCPAHGLWFDAGELGSLFRAEAGHGPGQGAAIGFLHDIFATPEETSP